MSTSAQQIARHSAGTMFSCVPPWMMPIFTWKFRAWSVRAAEEAELRAAVHALPQHDPDVRTEVSPGLGRPPFAKTPAIQALDDHAATLAAACGLPSAGERVAGGGSDGNVTGALGVPMLDGLGAIGGGPHTREECIEPRCLVPRTRLPARLIATLGPGVGGL